MSSTLSKRILSLLFTIGISTTLLHSKIITVHQMHPKASNKGTGSIKQPFQTISAAAAIAQPGDTVLVFGGTYRERVMPARSGEPGKPVVYMAAPGEKVILKGSDIWKTNGFQREKIFTEAKLTCHC
ncbi:MAG: hypothetical protein HC905_18705 [Bacteroidales bacterium]|nr:hypothetical protein [Bacteroidales bacterium]